METKLEVLKDHDVRYYHENMRFRVFLKRIDVALVDERVRDLNQRVSEGIDCKACGNCCRELRPRVRAEDIGRIAVTLGLPESFVREDHLEMYDGEFLMKGPPCQFLECNKCTVYDDRPKDCRDFPHLSRPGFVERLDFVFNNYSVCPIIYNVIEELKLELDFRRARAG